jgi:hypothetical protein
MNMGLKREDLDELVILMQLQQDMVVVYKALQK